MNGNQEEDNIKEEIKNESEVIDSKKKQEEITAERSKACSFKTDQPDLLEINEVDTYFRTPLTDILVSEENYYILVELPGLNKKHVNITLQGGMLEIMGEKKEKHKEKKEEKKDKDKKEEKKDKDKKDKGKKKEKDKKIEGTYLRREIRSTNFFRCFQLPEDISSVDIDAYFKNGILRLSIPKKTAPHDEKQIIEIK